MKQRKKCDSAIKCLKKAPMEGTPYGICLERTLKLFQKPKIVFTQQPDVGNLIK